MKFAADDLQELLEAEFGGSTHSILVAVSDVSREICAYVGPDASRDTAPAARLLVSGCLTKLLTAAVARAAAVRSGVALESGLGSVPTRAGAGTRALLGDVSMRDLLEHTHGLDGSALSGCPLKQQGTIDFETLCMQLQAARRVSEPGVLFSYGNAGAWLAAAISEDLMGMSYKALLRELLSETENGSRTASLSLEGAPCPAGVRSWGIRVSSLMRFLRREMDAGISTSFLAAIRSRTTLGQRARRGWSAGEKANHFGWNEYEGGWFGHNSIYPGAPAFLRIHPDRQVALVLSSRDISPTTVVARLFGREYPDLLRTKAPRLLSTGGAASDRSAGYEGQYGSSRWRFSVDCSADRLLRVNVYDTRSGKARPQPCASARLIAAEDDVFVVKPSQPGMARFYQFLRLGGGRFDYLWDGETSFRRLETQ
jgi:CubicO group peptidase (beta-lactamase class C family)